MRILLVTNYFEPETGAAASRLTRLAYALHERGHDVTVLTSLPHYPQGRILDNYQGRLVVTEDRAGLRVIQTWLWPTASPRISRRLMSQLSFMLTVSLRGIASQRPDVLLIEAQPPFTGLAGVFLAGVKRRPYVLNISDLWPDHLLAVGAVKATSLSYRVARRIVDFTYRRAGGIAAMSPVWAEQIQTYAPCQKNIRVIYNGLDLERFRPGLATADFRERYKLGTARLISFIGTFATQYDLETMLAVAHRFVGREDVRFMFVGQGSQREIVRRAVERGDPANLVWLDWLAADEVRLAWNASYLTYWSMHPHELYHGTIPAKLYEALACGVPVAAMTAGVSADIIRSSGAGVAVVPGSGPEALAEAVGRLLDDDAYHQECSYAARRYAEAHFDYQQVITAYETLLADVISISRPVKT
ncbi:MAG: glycosyltransferase family 4 protein [Chloroflexi bacterium]|nr:glycosyltransferase family 4 protein [Chloroflexota bacterium]